MRRVASGLVIAAVLGFVTACSGDDTYCAELAEQRDGLEKADADKTVEVMQRLADVAPDELEPEWTRMADFAEKFARAKGDREKQRDLMSGLSGYESAYSTVVQDARQRCELDLEDG